MFKFGGMVARQAAGRSDPYEPSVDRAGSGTALGPPLSLSAEACPSRPGRRHLPTEAPGFTSGSASWASGRRELDASTIMPLRAG